MRKYWVLQLTVLLLLTAASLGAQSNEALDALLEQRTATLADAAYLVLAASGRIDGDSTAEQAASALDGQGWEIPERSADDPVTLGEYAYLLMQALEIKGGLMYRLLPGPRYAGRELAFLEIIKGDASPYRTFSGEEAIGILGRLLAWKEEQS